MKNGQPPLFEELTANDIGNYSLPDCKKDRKKLERRHFAGDRNQCPTCGEFFNSTAAFECHRTGAFGINRRCMTIAEMRAKGMAFSHDGFWITKPRLSKSISKPSVNANQAISPPDSCADTDQPEKTAEIAGRA